MPPFDRKRRRPFEAFCKRLPQKLLSGEQLLGTVPMSQNAGARAAMPPPAHRPSWDVRHTSRFPVLRAAGQRPHATTSPPLGPTAARPGSTSRREYATGHAPDVFPASWGWRNYVTWRPFPWLAICTASHTRGRPFYQQREGNGYFPWESDRQRNISPLTIRAAATQSAPSRYPSQDWSTPRS